MAPLPDKQLDLDRELDRVVDRFEQAIRRGEPVRIEDVLAPPNAHGPRLLTALLWAEIEYRQSKRGVIDWDDYVARFPQAEVMLKAAQAAAPLMGDGDTSRKSEQDSVADATTPQAAIVVPLAPLDLGDYLLEKRLGRGGQGEVYLAQQLSLGRQVAVKLLKSSPDDAQSVQRFLREARTLAQTQHPHIVTIHGIGKTKSGELFLVMEFIEGADLSKQIAARQFGIDEAVQIVGRISRAIEHAHARGVVHRDLKPSNVLWDAVRGPVVTDFGLAKDLRAVDALTMTEQMMGTPAYMAPEQVHRRFGEISERTDVYGLAATLFALLTGKPPIGPGPLAEILQQLSSSDPVRPCTTLRAEIPAALSLICQKGLAKSPTERYASVREFAAALDGWWSGAAAEGSAAIPPTVTGNNPAPPSVRLEPGAQFGRYRLVAPLSRDRTRIVFRAEDPQGRPILLKCLPEEWLSDRMKRSQFRQEVLLSSSLKHPCLAKVIEAGVWERTEFLALEFISGESVAQALARRGRFSEHEAVDILRPIAEALHLIHSAGVIYRDLRPQNILLVEDRRPMLAEVRFSEELAEHDNATLSGQGAVTAKYIAPELMLGRPSDVASDVYTLGATLYALLTGREPYADAENAIELLIEKNAGAPPAPRDDAICQLVNATLSPNPARRPASAAEFAQRLSQCVRKQLPGKGLATGQTDPTEEYGSPTEENLLHAVWDRLDPDLQDAFSLAYNKKRRTGSTRISTRDLFEALGRLNSEPLQRMLAALPPGSLPNPIDDTIPLDRIVLSEQPLLSDCVRDSLSEFQRFAPSPGKPAPRKLAPVDLFVDVAKYGHGPSVVQLREHGVDPEAIERIVQRLGLRVVRRESFADTRTNLPLGGDRMPSEEELLSHANVQFSVYRPTAIRPESWEPLLAFVHLSELPLDAPATMADPLAEVHRQAQQILGERAPGYQPRTVDSPQSIPHSAELTFAPSGDGLEFNPPARSFRWQEPVHREEFRFRAAARLDGQLARGRLAVYLGRLLIAEVNLAIRVDCNAAVPPDQPVSSAERAHRFRRIFACVCRADLAMVAEFRRYAQLLRDTIVTSQLNDEPAPDREHSRWQLIASADVFQLYWSHVALDSPEMEREWRYALSLGRDEFIRPLYWEEPFPTRPERSLPPPELLALGFQKIPASSGTASMEAVPQAPVSVHDKLRRVRKPRVQITYNVEPRATVAGAVPAVGDTPASAPVVQALREIVQEFSLPREDDHVRATAVPAAGGAPRGEWKSQAMPTRAGHRSRSARRWIIVAVLAALLCVAGWLSFLK